MSKVIRETHKGCLDLLMSFEDTLKITGCLHLIVFCWELNIYVCLIR